MLWSIRVCRLHGLRTIRHGARQLRVMRDLYSERRDGTMKFDRARGTSARSNVCLLSVRTEVERHAGAQAPVTGLAFPSSDLTARKAHIVTFPSQSRTFAPNSIDMTDLGRPEAAGSKDLTALGGSGTNKTFLSPPIILLAAGPMKRRLSQTRVRGTNHVLGTYEAETT